LTDRELEILGHALREHVNALAVDIGSRMPSNPNSLVSGWLRAAVLGANDGIISTSSLMLGAAAAATAKSDILLASVAGTRDRFVTTP
jgi:hypothetical protein